MLQQCKFLKERHFNLMLELKRVVSASGICSNVFIPLRKCVCVCVCLPPHARTHVQGHTPKQSNCHGVLITTSHTCFPPRLSTPPNPPTELLVSHVSPSKADPAPVVVSLLPVWVTLAPLSWSGLGSTVSHSFIVSAIHPKTKNHMIPKEETIIHFSKDSGASETTDTCFTIMVKKTDLCNKKIF